MHFYHVLQKHWWVVVWKLKKKKQVLLHRWLMKPLSSNTGVTHRIEHVLKDLGKGGSRMPLDSAPSPLLGLYSKNFPPESLSLCISLTIFGFRERDSSTQFEERQIINIQRCTGGLAGVGPNLDVRAGELLCLSSLTPTSVTLSPWPPFVPTTHSLLLNSKAIAFHSLREEILLLSEGNEEISLTVSSKRPGCLGSNLHSLALIGWTHFWIENVYSSSLSNIFSFNVVHFWCLN